MSTISNKQELPQGWSEKTVFAGYKTVIEWENEDPWSAVSQQVEKSIPVFEKALVPPSPRYAAWQEVGVATTVVIPSTSREDSFSIAKYDWKLLSREESRKVVADNAHLETRIFTVDMSQDYPETGLQGSRRILVHLQR